MYKYLFFSCIVLLCALPRNIVSRVPSSADDDNDDEGDIARIVGGYKASIQEFPYQAMLKFYKRLNIFACGGSVISPQYILTAAHCTSGTVLIKIRVGSTFAHRGGWVYTTEFYGAHPFYNPTTFDYDVALVHVIPRMTLDGTYVQAVKLPPPGSPVAPGTIFKISGWGAEWEDGSDAHHLMAVNIPVISSAECKKSYIMITPRMICASIPQGGIDACQGDSGGPAVSTGDGVQRGIVSWGVGCARPGLPGVYTNVASIRGWIQWMSGL